MMDCTQFNASTVWALGDQPYHDVYDAVRQCLNICQVVYGIGDLDLTGIGVILATVIQIVFSLFFFAFSFVDATFIAIFRPSHRPSAVSVWLRPHHQTCLYSSLLFTFTLTLAAAIYQFKRESTGIYDCLAMIYNLCCTIFSLVMNTVSCYEPIKRPRLFGVGLVVTVALGVAASIYVVATLRGLVLLRACQEFSQSKILKWYKAAPVVPRTLSYVEVISTIPAVMLPIGIWLWLRCLRVRRESETGLDLGPRRRKPLTQKVLGVILLLLSLATFGLVGVQLWQLLRERAGMDIVWDGTTGINKWGIGQIGAPLAWAPLITDMVYSLMEKLKRRWRNGENGNSQEEKMDQNHTNATHPEKTVEVLRW